MRRRRPGLHWVAWPFELARIDEADRELEQLERRDCEPRPGACPRSAPILPMHSDARPIDPRPFWKRVGPVRRARSGLLVVDLPPVREPVPPRPFVRVIDLPPIAAPGGACLHFYGRDARCVNCGCELH